MKKIKFLMQCKQMNGEFRLEEVYVINYDDYCYYYSPKFKGNENLFKYYQLIDKLTGICVVYSSNKDMLFINYEDNYERYQSMKKTEYYKNLSREYELKVREYKFEEVY